MLHPFGPLMRLWLTFCTVVHSWQDWLHINICIVVGASFTKEIWSPKHVSNTSSMVKVGAPDVYMLVHESIKTYRKDHVTALSL